MPELETLQKEYDDLRQKIWDGILTEIYNKDQKVGENYTKKFNKIVEGSDYNNEESIKKAKEEINLLEKQIKADLNKNGGDLAKDKKVDRKSVRKSMRRSIRKSMPVPAVPPKPPVEAAAPAKDDASNENGGSEDIKEIIKDSNKLKNHIKSKLWSLSEVSGLIDKMSKKYKNKNEYMPIGDLRRIYGTKGALMLIYRSENEVSGTKKAKSTYGRYCEKIINEYRNLKVEAAVLALASGTVNIKNLSPEDAKKLKELIEDIVKLKNREGSDGYNRLYDHLGQYLSGVILGSLGASALGGTVGAVGGVILTAVPAVMSLCVCPPASLAILVGGGAIGAALGATAGPAIGIEWVNDDIISPKEKMKEEEKNLMNDLKKLKSNDDHKKLVNKVLKISEKVSKNNITATSVKALRDYIKKYNSFVNESGKLATRYLTWVGKTKKNRLKKASSGQDVGGKDVVIDAYKMICMCLVAVCSKNNSHIKAGKKFFDSNKELLSNFVG